MGNSFQIIWQNEFVGKIVDVENDMWYLNGKWISEDTARAKQFQDKVSQQEAKAIKAEPTKGTLIKITDSYAVTTTNGIALSMEHNELFIRILSTEESIEWAFKNVK
jgi:major membrane immunogen (membrane-anchored lipoprotein)